MLWCKACIDCQFVRWATTLRFEWPSDYVNEREYANWALIPICVCVCVSAAMRDHWQVQYALHLSRDLQTRGPQAESRQVYGVTQTTTPRPTLLSNTIPRELAQQILKRGVVIARCILKPTHSNEAIIATSTCIYSTPYPEVKLLRALHEPTYKSHRGITTQIDDNRRVLDLKWCRLESPTSEKWTATEWSINTWWRNNKSTLCRSWSGPMTGTYQLSKTIASLGSVLPGSEVEWKLLDLFPGLMALNGRKILQHSGTFR